MIQSAWRILGVLSLVSGFLTLLKSPKGLPGAVLWLPKLWASSWSPVFTLMGGLGAVGGWIERDYFSLMIGSLGFASGVIHILLVTRPHHHFDRVFGADWEVRIPPDLRSRWWPRRYQFIQGGSPPAAGEKDVDLGKSEPADQTLLCDLWKPDAAVRGTGAAVIYLHGGLWQALDKGFLTRPLIRHLADQGHVIMDLAYSLTPGADLNRMLGDLKRAIVWMKSHAGELHIKPERIILMGVSGGAHLALLAAYAPGHPAFERIFPGADMSVRAVIAICGISDLRVYFHEYGRTTPAQPETMSNIPESVRPRVHDRTWLDRFLTRTRVFPAYRHGNMPGGALLLPYLLGGTLKEIPEIYKRASPIIYAGPHSPPTLQIFGGDDVIIPPSSGRVLHEALCQAGAKSIFIEIPGAVHGFDQYLCVSRRIAPAAQTATYDIERFLALMA